MSDLTDGELEAAATAHDQLAALNVNAYVDPSALWQADSRQRMALEIRRHRTAVAANEERVRSVVRDATIATLDLGIRSLDEDNARIADAIAARAAKQLATAAVRLPSRKEWDRGDTPGESADYVDGWNDALDADGRLLATGAKP